MPELKNTFETVKEASMRLRRTVIVYDGEPYVVLAITNHKPDGIFRIYLEPIGRDPTKLYVRPEPEGFPPEHAGLGPYMDTWLAEHPDTGILRKQMNSPLFNKFRPYPLGMCNMKGGGCYYIERMPTRKSEQGLTASMLQETNLTAQPDALAKRAMSVSITSIAFKECVMGSYPSAQECLTNLLDPDVTNTAVGFSREFAFVRGPMSIIFLAYKQDIVGVLPSSDFSAVRLGREFTHLKEVVEKTGLFQSIKI